MEFCSSGRIVSQVKRVLAVNHNLGLVVRIIQSGSSGLVVSGDLLDILGCLINGQTKFGIVFLVGRSRLLACKIFIFLFLSQNQVILTFVGRNEGRGVP